MPERPRRPLPGPQPTPRPAPIAPGPSPRPSPNLDAANAAAKQLAELRRCAPIVAACVQAANEMLALRPLLTEHRHHQSLGAIASGEMLRLNPAAMSLVCVPVNQPQAQLGTRRTTAPPPALAPAQGPDTGDILARLASLESRLGSLGALAADLDRAATEFAEHVHGYQFRWGAVLATTDAAGKMIVGGAPQPTSPPLEAMPSVDGQAELPYAGAPALGVPDDVRTARVSTLVADLEPVYARISAAARAFASHTHAVTYGVSNYATLTQAAVHPTQVVAWVLPDETSWRDTTTARPG
jgi:hypothetical protein